MKYSPISIIILLLIAAGICGGLENNDLSIHEALFQLIVVALFWTIYSLILKITNRARH